MKISLTPLMVAFASVVSCLSLNSCATDPYSYDPEGTSYNSVPLGYTALMVGGISYWHYDDHYCRHWPGHGYVVVPPPHGRPPYHRPPAYRPPGHKPGAPGLKPVPKPGPSFPGYKPGRPGAKPGNPGTKPPSGTPGKPVTRPSQPRPSVQPVSRPVGGGTTIQPRGSWGGSPSGGMGGGMGGGMRGGGMGGGMRGGGGRR
jgi:hypothetical protein